MVRSTGCGPSPPIRSDGGRSLAAVLDCGRFRPLPCFPARRSTTSEVVSLTLPIVLWNIARPRETVRA